MRTQLIRMFHESSPARISRRREISVRANVGKAVIEVRQPKDSDVFRSVICVEQIVRQRSQGVAVVADGLYIAERMKLQELLQTTRLPVVYAFRDNVVAGGLLSYGPDLISNYGNAAKYVDKILKGAKPVDLPVEQATKFELVINLKTARALGLTIPQSLLLRADEVIR